MQSERIFLHENAVLKKKAKDFHQTPHNLLHFQLREHTASLILIDLPHPTQENTDLYLSTEASLVIPFVSAFLN